MSPGAGGLSALSSGGGADAIGGGAGGVGAFTASEGAVGGGEVTGRSTFSFGSSTDASSRTCSRRCLVLQPIASAAVASTTQTSVARPFIMAPIR